MRKVKSCGVLVFRSAPQREFLLMRHANRYDLPKGHIKRGESELDCALRELQEETGIPRDALLLDDSFRCAQIYYPRYQRLGGEIVEKTLVIFLGQLQRDQVIQPSEHIGYQWFPWHPPHHIQAQGIDSLLAEVEAHLAQGDPFPTAAG